MPEGAKPYAPDALRVLVVDDLGFMRIALRQILAEIKPQPIVIMVSSYTQTGAAATMKALQLGAADFVSKESAFAKTDLGHIDSELRTKIRLWAERRGSAASPAPAPAGPRPEPTSLAG